MRKLESITSALDTIYCEYVPNVVAKKGYHPPIKKKCKIQRNEPCPCGSGKKYKYCCMDKF